MKAISSATNSDDKNSIPFQFSPAVVTGFIELADKICQFVTNIGESASKAIAQDALNPERTKSFYP